jgi:hypothetical protein
MGTNQPRRSSTSEKRKHFDWKIPKGARVTDWRIPTSTDEQLAEAGGESMEPLMGVEGNEDDAGPDPQRDRRQ